MTSLERVAAALDAHGCRPRRHGNGYRARCPVHEDGTPSLTVSEGRDVAVVLNCFAGCDSGAILAAIGLEWRDLNERRGWA